MGNTKSITGIPPAGASSTTVGAAAPPKIVKGGDHDMPLWALAVSEYLPWETRREVMFLSKSWYRNTTTLAYYRFLCLRLAHECGVYIPVTPPAGDTWRTLFYDLYHLRYLWKAKPLEIIGTTQKEHAKRSKISVYAKFRPSKQAIADKKNADSQRDGSDNDDPRREAGVTLPLHQKLAMIRMSHNIKSNRRALRLLTEEGSWFSAKWEALSEELTTATTTNDLTVKDVATHGDVENDENSPRNAPSSSASSSSGGPAASFTTREGRSQNRRLLALTAARRRAAAGEMGGHGSDALQARRNKEHQQMVSKVHSLDALSGRVVMLTPDVGLREFLFDGVLTGTSSQSYAYELCTKRLIMDLLNGFNATAIVYGQTGSGKTYSMFGKDEASAMGRDKDGKGIIPRACEELLQAVDHRQRYHGIDSELYVSYVEVFGDQVSDLLRQGQRCGHSKVAAQRYVLNGAAEYRVASMGDFEHVLRIGEQQKRRAATAMNDRSTRAHSLFIVTLKQRKAPTLIPDAALRSAGGALPSGAVNEDVTLTTRLFLADLGGSEQVKKSQVEAGQHRLIERDATTATDGAENTTTTAAATFSVGFQKAERMREAVNINLGLLALKKCIEALNQQSPYVPYQDSKLTMLLSDGLGGNCKTSIIVCANMDTAHASETVASLRFGERCARIETSARNNATILAGILADLDARIMELEQTILQKERWEVREVRREDVLAEDGTLEKALGGQEIIKQTVVVGAEQERLQLVQLLLQRQQFAGIRRDGAGGSGEGDDDEALWADDDVDVDGAALEAATSAAASAVASDATSSKSQRRKKVLGFGRASAAVYGFGDTYDENTELVEENDRFTAQTSTDALPKVLRRARRGVAWAQGGMDTPAVDSESFQKDVRKANKIRAKLAYSGISA